MNINETALNNDDLQIMSSICLKSGEFTGSLEVKCANIIKDNPLECCSILKSKSLKILKDETVDILLSSILKDKSSFSKVISNFKVWDSLSIVNKLFLLNNCDQKQLIRLTDKLMKAGSDGIPLFIYEYQNYLEVRYQVIGGITLDNRVLEFINSKLILEKIRG